MLFLCGVDPFAAVGRRDEKTLMRIVRTAHKEMRRSLLASLPGTTSQGRAGRYWVYQRIARPCRRCSTLIRRARQGTPSRTTYWCPRCQPAEVP